MKWGRPKKERTEQHVLALRRACSPGCPMVLHHPSAGPELQSQHGLHHSMPFGCSMLPHDWRHFRCACHHAQQPPTQSLRRPRSCLHGVDAGHHHHPRDEMAAAQSVHAQKYLASAPLLRRTASGRISPYP